MSLKIRRPVGVEHLSLPGTHDSMGRLLLDRSRDTGGRDGRR